MEPAASELPAPTDTYERVNDRLDSSYVSVGEFLRVGTAAEMADAVTRSHLPDGRVVGWYGAPGVAIDAELYDDPPPPHLAARFGAEEFWERWTATECAVKREDCAMAVHLAERGLDWAPHEVVWVRDAPAEGVLVAVLL